MKYSTIRRDVSFGACQFINYIFIIFLFFGGFVFIITGIASWNSTKISFRTPFVGFQFFPQGMVICFYGIIALILSFYLLLNRFYSVGAGFNEYDKEKEQIQIFRWGFPGKFRRIELVYSFLDLESIVIERKLGLSRYNLYLRFKNKRKFFITQFGTNQIYSPQQIENFAVDLAYFLQIRINGEF